MQSALKMTMEVTIRSFPNIQTHVVSIQSSTETGWSTATTATVRDDPSAGNLVRAAVMRLIEEAFA